MNIWVLSKESDVTAMQIGVMSLYLVDSHFIFIFKKLKLAIAWNVSMAQSLMYHQYDIMMKQNLNICNIIRFISFIGIEKKAYPVIMTQRGSL